MRLLPAARDSGRRSTDAGRPTSSWGGAVPLSLSANSALMWHTGRRRAAIRLPGRGGAGGGVAGEGSGVGGVGGDGGSE